MGVCGYAAARSEVDLLTPLRAGASLDELRQLILEVSGTSLGHGLEDGLIPLNRVMSEIGG